MFYLLWINVFEYSSIFSQPHCIPTKKSLEQIQVGSTVEGILPGDVFTVESVKCFGSDVLQIIGRDSSGKLREELLYRNRVSQIEIVEKGRAWSFDADGNLFKLTLEASRTGNWFIENELVIARLDKLSRDESLHPKLDVTEWDLVIFDEAHKLSASYSAGNEIKYTKRYRLAQLISPRTRHFLLMTVTPHNGKEEEFQLFLALLDGDRFEGKFRDGIHKVDVDDMMRRLIKEQLVRFDGSPIFPRRFAFTVKYELSALEAHLYSVVTNYVKEEFNRAEKLEKGKKSGQDVRVSDRGCVYLLHK